MNDNAFHYNIIIELKFKEQLRKAKQQIKQLDQQLDALEKSGKTSTKRGQAEQSKLIAARQAELDYIERSKREIKALKAADAARAAELKKAAEQQAAISTKGAAATKKKTTKKAPVPEAVTEKDLADATVKSVKTRSKKSAQAIVDNQKKGLADAVEEVATQPTAPTKTKRKSTPKKKKEVAEKVKEEVVQDTTATVADAPKPVVKRTPKVREDTNKAAKSLVGNQAEDLSGEVVKEAKKVTKRKVTKKVAQKPAGDIPEVVMPAFTPTGNKAIDESAKKVLDKLTADSGKVRVALQNGARGLEEVSKVSGVNAANVKVLIPEYRDLADAAEEAASSTEKVAKAEKTTKTKPSIAEKADKQKQAVAEARTVLGSDASTKEIAALAGVNQTVVEQYDDIARAAKEKTLQEKEALKAQKEASKIKPPSFSQIQDSNLLPRTDYSTDPLVQAQPTRKAQEIAIKELETTEGLQGNVDVLKQTNGLLKTQEKIRVNNLSEAVELNGQNQIQAKAELDLVKLSNARKVALEKINKAYAQGIRGSQNLSEATGVPAKQITMLHEATRLEEEIKANIESQSKAKANLAKEQETYLKKLEREKELQKKADARAAKEKERGRLLATPASQSVIAQGGTATQVSAAVSAVKQNEIAKSSNQVLNNLRAETSLQEQYNALKQQELILTKQIAGMDVVDIKIAQDDLARLKKDIADTRRITRARGKGFTTPTEIAAAENIPVKRVIALDPEFREQARLAAIEKDRLDTLRKQALAERQKRVEAERLTRAARKAAEAQGFFGEHASRALFTFRRLVGIMAVFTLARQLANGIGMAAREAVKFNAELEDARISLAALVAGTGNISLGGINLEGVDEYKTGLTVADDIILHLRKEAIKTTATFEDLISAFSTAVGPGLSAGLNIDQITQVAVNISKTAAALKVPSNQLGEEVRSLINGTITLRNTRLAVIGVTNTGIRQARAEGRLYEYLTDKMSSFAAASDDVAKSFSGLKSNVWDVFQGILSFGSATVFDEMKVSMEAFFNAMQDQQALMSGEDSTFGINKVAIQGVLEISDSIRYAIEDMRKMFASGDTLQGFVSVARSLGDAIKGAAFILNSFIAGVARGIRYFSAWLNFLSAIKDTITNIGGEKLLEVFRGIIVSSVSIMTLMVLWSNTFGLLFNKSSKVFAVLRAILKTTKAIVASSFMYAASLVRLRSLTAVWTTSIFLIRKAWMSLLLRFAAGGIALAPVYLIFLAIAGAIAGIITLTDRWVPISKKVSEVFTSLKQKASEKLGLTPLVSGEDAQLAEFVSEKMKELRDASRDANLELAKFREMRGLGDAASSVFQPILDVIYDTEKGLKTLNERIEYSEKRLQNLKESPTNAILTVAQTVASPIPLETDRDITRTESAKRISEEMSLLADLQEQLDSIKGPKPISIGIEVTPADPDFPVIKIFDEVEEAAKKEAKTVYESIEDLNKAVQNNSFIDFLKPEDPKTPSRTYEEPIKKLEENIKDTVERIQKMKKELGLSAEEAIKLSTALSKVVEDASKKLGVTVTSDELLSVAREELINKQALVAEEQKHNDLLIKKQELLDANSERIRTITEQALEDYSQEKLIAEVLRTKASAYETVKEAMLDANMATKLGNAALSFRAEASRQEYLYAQQQVVLAQKALDTNNRIAEAFVRGTEAAKERSLALEAEATSLTGQAGKASELLAIQQERSMLEGFINMSEEERNDTLEKQKEILQDNLELMLALAQLRSAEQAEDQEKAFRAGLDPVSRGAYDYTNDAPSIGEAISESITSAFKTVETSLASAMGNWVKTGKFDAKSMGIDMAAQMVQQVTAMLIQQIISWILSMIFTNIVFNNNTLATWANTVALWKLTAVLIARTALGMAKGGIVPRHYASGGGVESALWSRKGVPASDTVPAWLTPGEWVLSRAEVSQLRSGPIDFRSLMSIIGKIRGVSSGSYGSLIKGFADGGPVSESMVAAPSVDTQANPVIVPGFIANEHTMSTLINNGPQALTRFLVKSGVQFRR